MKEGKPLKTLLTTSQTIVVSRDRAKENERRRAYFIVEKLMDDILLLYSSHGILHSGDSPSV